MELAGEDAVRGTDDVQLGLAMDLEDAVRVSPLDHRVRLLAQGRAWVSPQRGIWVMRPGGPSASGSSGSVSAAGSKPSPGSVSWASSVIGLRISRSSSC